jgi:uncharacterized RDD family membrane protein YckC
MANPYAPPQAAVLDIADPIVPARLADRGTRFAASLIDGITFSVAFYGPLIYAFGFSFVFGAGDADAISDAAALSGVGLALVGFCIWCGFTLRYMHLNGQSIGKKLLSIKVVRSNGSPISLGRLVWLRNVVNWLISLIPLYGFIEVLFIFGESRQCLHDKLADTIVVQA